MTDVTSTTSPQGVVSVTMTLNKADKALSGQEALAFRCLSRRIQIRI
jgi:hypothetical protein